MEITRVTDDADALRWAAVEAAACAHDFVALPADPPHEAVAQLHADGATGERWEHLLGTDAGEAVALAKLTLPTQDNLGSAEVEVRVLPGRRRQGLGTAMWQAASARCRELGRPLVTTMVPGRLDGIPTPGEAFAARHGFTAQLADVRRLLDVAAVDDTDLRRLVDEAAHRAEGYVVETWVDRAPAARVDGLAVLAAGMSTDAPQGELEHEPEVWDAARWLAHEQDAVGRGRRRYGALARHGDEVVAYTDIGVSTAAPVVGYQWNTIVRRDHRGHRLGMLVKAANLRQLRAGSPGTRWLNTWNAASNVWMVAVNEALGFRPADTWTEQQRRL